MAQSSAGYWGRRALHIAFSAVLIYYLVPDEMFRFDRLVIHRSSVLLILWCIAAAIEARRLTKGKVFPVSREHERGHMSSYMWFSTGAVLLILTAPQHIAAPCILATSLADPVIGEARRATRLRRRFVILSGILVCLAPFFIFGYPWPLAVLSGMFCFGAEYMEVRVHWRIRPDLFWSRSKKRYSKLRHHLDSIFTADDDFIMQWTAAVLIFLVNLLAVAYAMPWFQVPMQESLRPLY